MTRLRSAGVSGLVQKPQFREDPYLRPELSSKFNKVDELGPSRAEFPAQERIKSCQSA